MAEQVSEEQTRQKELNDMSQNKSNDRRVTVEDENSEGDKSDSKNDTTSFFASTGETVEVAISTKKIKNNPNPNTGSKKDNGDDPYDPYVNSFNFINFIQTFRM